MWQDLILCGTNSLVVPESEIMSCFIIAGLVSKSSNEMAEKTRGGDGQC